MSGFAFVHRSLIGHPAFRNDSEAMAFAYLVLKASWKPTSVRYKGRIIELSRGQLSMSVRDFAAAMDRDKGWAERLFARLKSATMIETDNKTGVNVITICNYGKYQSENEAGKTGRETQTETGPRHRTIREEIKEPFVCSDAEPVSEPETHTNEILIPDWVPGSQWAAFVAMRDRKRAPVTAYAAERLFEAMEEIGAAGWDLAKVLDRATRNAWTDLRMPVAGQDDALRRSQANGASKTGRLGKPADQAAYLAQMRSRPFYGAGRVEEPGGPPIGPRSLGQLAAGIASACEGERVIQ